MSVGIVYFSRDNNTKAAAEYLARRKNAVLVRLVEERPSGFISGGWNALRQKAVKLVGEPWKDVQDCEDIYVMTPIWASHGTPAMNAFLQQMDFSGKKVSIITFQADPNINSSIKTHKKISSIVQQKGGNVAATLGCHGARPGSFAGDEHIQAQLQDLVE